MTNNIRIKEINDYQEDVTDEAKKNSSEMRVGREKLNSMNVLLFIK